MIEDLDGKKKCPTFSMVVDRIAKYFEMDVKATRFNWYRDSQEWKPFHHDANFRCRSQKSKNPKSNSWCLVWFCKRCLLFNMQKLEQSYLFL